MNTNMLIDMNRSHAHENYSYDSEIFPCNYFVFNASAIIIILPSCILTVLRIGI